MYQPPQQVVTKRGANHGLHVVLTILTCGIWAITGWPIAAAMGRKTTTVYNNQVPPPQGYFPPPGQQTPPWGQQSAPPGYGYPPQQATPPTYGYPPPQQPPPPGYGYPPQQPPPSGQYGPPSP